jgi:hypothetical protein
MDPQLFVEAFVVGVGLVAVYYLVKMAKLGEVATVFLAGALFHLVAEVSGVNDWYLDNSVAAKKRSGKEKQ